MLRVEFPFFSVGSFLAGQGVIFIILLRGNVARLFSVNQNLPTLH